MNLGATLLRRWGQQAGHFFRQPVSRGQLVQQALITASATGSYVVATPLFANLITGQTRWYSLAQVVSTVGISAFFSFVPVYGLIPVGHRLQTEGNSRQRFWGKVKTIGLETLYTAVVYQCLVPVYGWNAAKSFWGALWQGPTKGIPLSSIYKRWGNQGLRAAVLRQGAMILMMTNQAVVNSIASSSTSETSDWVTAEVAVFNLFLGGVVAMIPSPETPSSGEIR